MEKQLLELAALLPDARLYGSMRLSVSDITADSRTAGPGSLFICLKGAHVDGHRFLDKAIEQGAVAAIVEDLPKKIPEGVAVIRVADTREAMEAVTPYFYDYPGKSMRMIGVTGTNGKTTTTNIIRRILTEAGHKTGLIGTINVMIGEVSETAHNTTPDVVDLEKTLYAMKTAGCDYVVMEVSSHALALKRVAGIEYDCAVLTNITQDHLDFHKTMASYRDAKSLLFEGLRDGAKGSKHAVLNMDDPSSGLIRSRTKASVLTYGMGDVMDIHPVSFEIGAKAMSLKLATPAGEMDLSLRITGEFNVYNVMAAVAATLAEGIDKETIVRALSGFTGVPGRFQLVEAGQPYTVVVDYAHTPDGLENVLRTARQITRGRLWAVFGCGGDRDSKKRPIMGELALRLADNVVVTSDNPRSEDPERIIDEIMAGMDKASEDKRLVRLSDRREAIEYALAAAGAEDVILICGKGHEDYQILKNETIHFDDREVVQDYWRGRK